MKFANSKDIAIIDKSGKKQTKKTKKKNKQIQCAVSLYVFMVQELQDPYRVKRKPENPIANAPNHFFFVPTLVDLDLNLNLLTSCMLLGLGLPRYSVPIAP